MSTSMNQSSGSLFLNVTQVELLHGNNYKNWRKHIDYHVTMTPGMDLCIVDEQPEELNADSNPEERKAYRDWHNNNRKAKTLIRTTMIDSIRRSIEEPDTAWDFLEAISEKYLENDKAEILRLNREFNGMSFSGNDSVREHIMTMMNLNSRLRDLEVGVKDEQVVAQALESLSATYSNLKTTYNASEEK
ncbi:PREDICTED: uncharacterized protein LOC101302915 isoform X2 [Fragaria vesca subsp. vesca]|uniref:uncharacterized protein LOC101302915 isoform X2 n=1 Tax=Fragaria vesca subsp. vesca TaxID=101020 RepID=UPI0002C36179|nr:PREDICTED: uncharacterized protein LOC101302915 isoform X2 [Fragaria vesca subsp. vesca]